MRDLELKFDEASHSYFMRGRRAPGIHEVLRGSGFLAQLKDDAEYLERGRAVHLATEYDDQGRFDEAYTREQAPELLGYVEAWRRYRAEQRPVIKAIEELVGNAELWYATRVDRRLEFRTAHRGVTLTTRANLKTGLPRKWYALQDAAESMCYPYRTAGLAVYLRPDGSYEEVPFDGREAEEAREIWRCATSIYDWRVRHGDLSVPAAPEEKPAAETVPVADSVLFSSAKPGRPSKGGLFGEAV